MSLDPRFDLLDAILKKRARIAQMERTLSQPKPPGLKRGNSLAMEEKQEHDKHALAELQAEYVRLYGPIPGAEPPGQVVSMAKSEASMNYPSEFSRQAVARVEKERLIAARDLAQRSNRLPWNKYGPGNVDEESFRTYILQVFLAFALEGCALGFDGSWTVDRIREEADEFLRRFTIEAYYSLQGQDRQGRRLREMTSHLDGSILPEVRRGLEHSLQWQQFQDALHAVGEAQASAPAPARQAPGKPRMPRLPSYRGVKRLILIQLINHPDATDRDICRYLDDDDAQLPEEWVAKSGDRLFTSAYKDPGVRQKIHKAISTVRGDLRQRDLL